MDAMLGKMVRELVAIPSGMLAVVFDLLKKLGGEHGDEWLAMLKKFLRKEECWKKKAKVFVLKVAKTVFCDPNVFMLTIPVGKFVVAEHIANLRTDAHSQKWFLGKVETHVGGTSTLRYRSLGGGSTDAHIIAELGEEAVEISFAEACELVNRQREEQAGHLLVDGGANIFYIRDIDGILRSVRASVGEYGWYFDAYSCEDGHEWGYLSRVITRV